MMVLPNGVSVIAAGLDHWYQREDLADKNTDIDEFIEHEWRLEQRLRVSHLRVPPEFRRPDFRSASTNNNLTIPYLRFPQWHFCPACSRLQKLPLATRGKVKCQFCKSDKKFTPAVTQVPFVAICAHAHIQDFPWSEWVHKSVHPECSQQIFLRATGGATLGGQRAECECGKKRTLGRITHANPDGSTFLSSALDPDGFYLCRGQSPWHGSEAVSACGQPLRGALRTASNVYFPQVRCAIFLPRGSQAAPTDLVAKLEGPPVSETLAALSEDGRPPSAQLVRRLHPALVREYTDEQVSAALTIVHAGLPAEVQTSGDSEVGFRLPEYEVLAQSRDDEQLVIQPQPIANYGGAVAPNFARVSLVQKLRETRVLAGFSRVFPEDEATLDQQMARLWKSVPSRKERWLPASLVYGEGIFFQFDVEQLNKWETRQSSLRRANALTQSYNRLAEERKAHPPFSVSARLLLVHTFSHLLINRLTFESGYSSAALRERLYVGSEPDGDIAGLLVYTSAGDSEGTMGGLVRLGKAGCLESIVERALSTAKWCSADPVCMEIGSQGGQGPDSCNLAACHSCTLVPETTCELANRFLDRAMVVGDLAGEVEGFFDPAAGESGSGPQHESALGEE